MNRPRVKLIGQNGNAFMVLGLCLRAAKRAGWTQEEIDKVRTEMTSGDYDNLLGTAMRYFDVE